MTKNEIMASLKKSDKWIKDMVCDDYTDYYFKSEIFSVISIIENKIILNDMYINPENCNLIDSIPMKSGKTYSAIICKLPGITIEVEL
jgi:hypothetical protein